MQQSQQFYEKQHNAGSYGGGAYNLKSLLAIRGLNHWLAQPRTRPLRWLDVGCGQGVFLRDLAKALRAQGFHMPLEITGTDIARSPGNFFAEIPAKTFQFLELDVDGHPLPFPDHSFDLVSCNHVLEHIFQTELLVREFRRIMEPQGLCIISVPNVACWPNRLAFLFGGQPLSAELGTEKGNYGIWPRFLRWRFAHWKPSGHIRDFTPRGLQDLTGDCGFSTVGWWRQSHRFYARLGKWAGLELGIVLKRATP